jgi:peptidoglycan hydrolase-like protein with peptidoglycan-binding domain
MRPSTTDVHQLLDLQQSAGNRATTAFVQRLQEGGGPARRTLQPGDTGDDVKALQMKLRDVRERDHDRDDRNRARIDGIFGPLTRQDVVDFQSDAGLDADAIVGPRTWDALDSLVTSEPAAAAEGARDDAFAEGQSLRDQGKYDEASTIFERLADEAATPELMGPSLVQAGICHQQRARFAIAIDRYEQALRGRFNQEALRAEILDKLGLARQDKFLPKFNADPDTAPPQAGAGSADRGAARDTTSRESVRGGQSGPSVDLFKGKLAHLMVGWDPALPSGDSFDGPTIEKTIAFQQQCGLPETGEADAATWHALDSFTKADVPFSIVDGLFQRSRAAFALSKTDPAAGLPGLQGVRDEAAALGLREIVANQEALIAQAHHRASDFDRAVEHYELYLARNIPSPGHYGQQLEHLRRARRREPIDDLPSR